MPVVCASAAARASLTPQSLAYARCDLKRERTAALFLRLRRGWLLGRCHGFRRAVGAVFPHPARDVGKERDIGYHRKQENEEHAVRRRDDVDGQRAAAKLRQRGEEHLTAVEDGKRQE